MGSLSAYLGSIGTYPITLDVVISILVLLILLLFSALMSGSESAYFSLSPANIKELESGKPGSTDAKALKNLDDTESLLATILVWNNLVNVGIVIISSYITNSLLDFSQAPIAGFLFEIVIITFLLLLFGEILPKMLASNRPMAFARFMASPLQLLIRFNQPISKLLIKSVGRIGKHTTSHNNLSMDELNEALDITNSEDISDEKKILKGIVTFGNIIVSEILKPRVDVVAVDYSTTFSSLVKIAVESGYSRIPVYIDNFDSVKGILYIKDLIPYIEKDDTFQWQNLIREPYFVPESKKINDLLNEFQQKKIHLAIVVDEYGGNNGIITLEDILEEIVGEISDESDEEEHLYTRIDANTYLFEAKVQINDFCKIVDCRDDVFDGVRGEAETLAGLVLEITGQLPIKGFKLAHKQFQFIIDSVDNRRIKKIKVVISPNVDEE